MSYYKKKNKWFSILLIGTLLFTLLIPTIVFAEDIHEYIKKHCYTPGHILPKAISVATDSKGNGYLLYSHKNQIMKLDPDRFHSETWGNYGNGPREFNCPNGIAIDNEDNIYVADSNNNRIQKLNPDGTLPAIWSFGSYGSGNGQFNYPCGVAVDNKGNIYVADTKNNRIQKLNPDGTFSAAFGSYGSENGKFKSPNGATVDNKGNIYVADSYNHRIQKLNPDGTFSAVWNNYGSKNREFNYPFDVEIDEEGNVYVTDLNKYRIQLINASPVIVETDEIDVKNNVEVDKSIIVHFNEHILATDKIKMIRLMKDNVEIDYVYHINGNTLTIDPNENLDYNSMYKVIIPSKSVKDMTDQYLEEEYTFNFTTITDTASPK